MFGLGWALLNTNTWTLVDCFSVVVAQMPAGHAHMYIRPSRFLARVETRYIHLHTIIN
jgi:hypothetical protein